MNIFCNSLVINFTKLNVLIHPGRDRKYPKSPIHDVPTFG